MNTVQLVNIGKYICTYVCMYVSARDYVYTGILYTYLYLKQC